MVQIKLATCVLVLVAVASAVEDGNFIKIPREGDHNIINCDADGQATWKKLDSGTVSQKGKFLQIVEGTATYPSTGTGEEVITCIRVIDRDANGYGGYPEILEGGLGFHHVIIRFVSQRHHGYKFAVEIWGKKTTTVFT